MGWLNSEKPPSKYDGAYIKMLVERIRLAVNNISENNIQTPLNADAVLADKTLSVKKLYGVEFQHTLVALAVPFSTTSTSLINVSGYYHLSNTWGNRVNAVFEVTGGSANAAATATFELHGVDGKLAEVKSTTGVVDLEWLRSAPFDLPTTSQTFLVKMKTSNATYAANLFTARLIITPK